jgi:phenylalanyl-tRNA synthetase alpha chain
MYAVSKLEDYSPESLDRAAGELKSALEAEAAEAAAIPDEAAWKEFRDRWMGRKSGVLTQVNDLWLKAAPPESKREIGRRVNEIKNSVEQVVEAARERSTGVAVSHRLQAEAVDITLPGIRRPLGGEHPIMRSMHEVIGVFQRMGYSVAEGPEVETDYYNFEALNFPPNHPARDAQDTLFLSGQEGKPQRDRLVLRTHTSPVQIRYMEKHKPPVRIVAPGRVYRRDTPDATHSPMFHQLEGLAVDDGITFADLKGTLDHAMKSLFGSSVRTRFRPSFFPFTEPSAEMLLSCPFCGGDGCRVCKQSGWIELLGAGMVDPAVFRAVGYDPEKVTGFAFGMGVDRIAALRWDINDLQLFFQGDVRFLEQFA